MSDRTTKESHALDTLRRGGRVWSITATQDFLNVLDSLKRKGLVVSEPAQDRRGNPKGCYYSAATACQHANLSLATSSDWESVCADCGEVVQSAVPHSSGIHCRRTTALMPRGDLHPFVHSSKR